MLLAWLAAPVEAVATSFSELERWAGETGERIQYGPGELQFGELLLPTLDPPSADGFPVAVVVHGGCWLSQYDLRHIRKLSAAIANTGYAVWTIEYRRVGNPGGGWPGTFADVADAMDHLRALARAHPLDLRHVAAVGHSAGGQLALWLANRPDGMFAADSVVPTAVLSLAPAADLEFLQRQNTCGGVVRKLLGGSAIGVPERYAATSSTRRVLTDTPHTIVVGERDFAWTPVAMRYVAAARAARAPVKVLQLPHAGHFELIDPDDRAGAHVLDALRELLPPRVKRASAYSTGE